MNPERQRQIEQLFQLAAALEGSAREALLLERCAGDSGLRAEVESLLAHDAGNEDEVLSAPPIARGLLPRNLMAADADDRLRPGTRIGAYTIHGLLGRGGMGTVYVAEQESPRRKVALKLIRTGPASGATLRRMQLEAELLGRLKHPGIAQIFEAGRADYGTGPQPFFAMEFVDGQMLDRHADSQGLGVRDRLGIVLKVCEAVEHAHQRGVIHRDLKPGNILVERGGGPKILDFGVARATGTGQSTQQTGVGQLIGTLPYMSPEQLTGDPAEVDTRSDVYALGVILFQLLTGRLPHDLGSAPLAEAARIVREEPVPRLSAIAREFRGDIETIVAKAMDKDRARRYQSAAALAEDIRRYLDGLPIRARDDSAMYILRKQIRRYQGVAAVGSIAVIALSGLSIYATSLARRERDSRAQADQARDTAEGQRRAADALRDKAELQAERLRRSFYFNRIGFAQAAMATNDADRMRRLLDECPEDLRGWEWRYLNRHADQSTRTVVCRQPSVGGGAVSGDGAVMAVWGVEPEIAVLDVRTGEARGRMRLALQPMVAALDREGRRIAIATGGGRLELREVQSGVAAAWLRVVMTGQVRACAFAPEGTRIAVVGTHEDALVLDAETGAVVERLPCGAVDSGCVAVSGDGAWIAVGNDRGEVRIFESATGRLAAMLPLHRAEVRDLAFASDNRGLATCGNDGIVRLAMREGGVWTAGAYYHVHNNKVGAVAFSPDGSRLASAGTETVIRILRLADGEVERTLAGHTQSVMELAYSPEGKSMVSTSRDGTAKWWDLSVALDDPTSQDLGRGLRAAMSPDGARLFIGGEAGPLRSFFLPDLSPVDRVRGPEGVRMVAVAPAGDLLVTGGMTEPLRALDARTGASLRELANPGTPLWSGVFVSDDVVVAGGFGRTLNAFNARTGERRWTATLNAEGAMSLAFDRSTNRIAVGTRAGPILLLDAATGAPAGRLGGHVAGTGAVAFMEGGARLASGGHDGLARLWNTQSGEELAVFRGHKGNISSITVIPGRVITGSMDNTVRIWDAGSGEEVLSLRHHTGAVTFVGATPDGRAVVSCSDDGSVRVWDAAPRQ